ncbi:glycoside hydrolase domain-containing protein [Maribacter polysaccharolyticus]|uniref:glycoside hydrolase domain-containing protein n=1 Tax=Maribacter polysaccharolyticus TaxID=3020831 RepID=UPI00237F5E19|nr:glycoside hydrolase domain-containing protein [Maribacter polysaccharolyticus]MDE3741766.1 glycoside hydrolase family 92 protein [Maribacter polysaccharolyticus]
MKVIFKWVVFGLVGSILSCQGERALPDGSETPSDKVNVFLGTSGDHGQLSPSAASPFNMISIGPVTHPQTHTGYEHYAKEFLGFVHTHMEGVGCLGGGGNILVKPLGEAGLETKLHKKNEKGRPGYYGVSFENGIKAEMAVAHNYGVHKYAFPHKDKSLFVAISHAFVNRFVAEEHVVRGNTVQGWVDTKTVCDRGQYRLYFYMAFSNADTIERIGEHTLRVHGADAGEMTLRIGFSSISEAFAKKRVMDNEGFETTRENTGAQWDAALGRVVVSGEKDRESLFYSLLYRGLQAPFLVSEPDGSFKAVDGSVQYSETAIYNGWAIWDNYREQLPLLSLIYPDTYGDISRSIAQMYRFGKKDWATMNEPSNTVRTEHALIVLLDAYKKGHRLPLATLKDALAKEAERLDFAAPDKALESSYDLWALSELMLAMGDTTKANEFLMKAMDYKTFWKKDFKELDLPDVDQMGARGLYQGTLWQYRWFVPFDIEGLKELVGGEETFVAQLDEFFAEFNYNHANQPDLQVPGLYNATQEPWKSQKLFRNIMLDTVVQFYFNNNSKGVDPYIGRIYQNRPKAYLRTMDDDMGTLSSWFVLRAMGLSPVNVGEPVYYVTAPIFQNVGLHWPSGRSFNITVSNYHKDNYYIKSVRLNGKTLERNWLTHEEIMAGGELLLETDSVPHKKWGTSDPYISKIDSVGPGLRENPVNTVKTK